MKNNLSFERIADTDYQMTTDYGVVRVETILFHKHTKEKDIYHKARKITYQDKTKKGKIRFISLLTNDFQMSAEDIIAIYKRRWQIETLFNVSSTNSEQCKLCVNGPLYIDARLHWKQAIGSNCS